MAVVACTVQGSTADSSAVADSAAQDSAAPPRPYTVRSDTGGWGSIAVTVALADSAPRDSALFAGADSLLCGTTLRDNSLRSHGKYIEGAAVWLAATREGKPLPVQRRFEIVHEGCQLWPRVQTATIGGTLNIRNMDNGAHVLRLTDARTGNLLARITQSVRGQVVPLDEVLRAPRRIEVTCELHGWTRGWIYVFDHPYHATTDAAGAAQFDSVPAGPHAVAVWHERLGEERTTAQVISGSRSVSEILFGRPR